MPPPELIGLVNTGAKAEPGEFLRSGLADMLNHMRALDAAGLSLEGCRAVLEFGCGAGRLLRHWLDADVELSGCDFTPAVLDWCRAHLPGARFERNAARPPLPYRDAEFDFVYANSVFTHIPLALQDAWLAELRRVLRPGGVLLATVLGAHHRAALLDDAQRAELEAAGSLERGPVYAALDAQAAAGLLPRLARKARRTLHRAGLASAAPVYFAMVFQTPARLEAALAPHFKLLRRHEVPDSQEILVLAT
ncbi:MAG: class I SAM-dependent methyltransferase [Planctomycetota bacterium]|nr:class I SAM-dependent methyltransferase [Planctomycetota bacterium]